MKNSVGFVYFKRNKYNLFSAEPEMNCVILRSYFEKIGVETSQYCNETLPNILDIVDDIISEYNDVVCLYVDDSNEEFTLAIAKALWENDEETDIILLYEKEGSREEVDYGEITYINIAKEKLEEQLEIPADKKFELQELELIAYKNNYLYPRACGDYGLVLNKKFPVCNNTLMVKPEILINEITYIARIINDNENIKLISDDIHAYPELQAFLELLSKASIKQKITIAIPNFQVTEELVNQLASFNIAVLSNKTDEKHFNKLGVDEGDVALINGMQTYFTGYYHENNLDGYTKHIQLDKSDINPEILKMLSAYNSANSAIYCNLTNTDSCYNQTKQIAEEAGYLFTNLLEFKELDDKMNLDLCINGRERGYRINISPYSEYEISQSDFTYLNVNTKKDLENFLEDVKNFNLTGVVQSDKMWRFNLIDQCRWSTNTTCKLNKLPRFKVCDEEIYPCINCNKSVGNISNIQFEMMKNLSVEIDREHIKRKCDECPVNTYCSKCVCLPDFLSSEEYCELMKSDLAISRFILKMNQIKYLLTLTNLSALQGISIDDVVIMTKNNCLEIEVTKHGTHKYINEDVLFIKIPKKSAYMAFNPLTRKTFTLNGNMFAVCELLNKGLGKDEMVELLQGHYNLTKEASNQVLYTAFNFLQDKGCLQRKAEIDVL